MTSNETTKTKMNKHEAASPRSMRVGVVIPALNEEASIGRVLDDIPRELVHRIVVADNGSTDATAARARAHGAVVIAEPDRGYGAACQTGIAAQSDCDIIAFLDADYSDHPEELEQILAPIFAGEADMVLGSRLRGAREAGALPFHSILGNKIFAFLLKLCFGARCSDLGPFRAIRRDALESLGMVDRNYGWTIEMQIKAARKGLRVVEIPVRYRKRIGKSKVTGSLTGSFKAATKIFYILFKYALVRPA